MSNAHREKSEQFRVATVPASGFRRRVATREGDAARRASGDAVARAQQGDLEALRWLYARYADNVYGHVLGILRDHHEAEDVTQQVFAKLMRALTHYEDHGAPFLGWLLRLARNAALDELRARRTVPVAAPLGHVADCADGDRDRLETLRSALDALPVDQREIIVLRHLGGFAHAEIAARLRRSDGAIHALHHRGRSALRAELRRLGVAPVTRAA